MPYDNLIKPGYWGAIVGSDSKNNFPIGSTSVGMLSHRFRASESSAITHVRWPQRWGTDYSIGTGGTMRLTLQSDSGGNPSGTVLASVADYSPGNPGTASNFRNFAFITPYTVTKGTVYHIVVQNVHASPTSNNMSWNDIFHYDASERPPGLSDDYVTMFSAGGWSIAQSNRNIGVMDLTYANGQHDGHSYIHTMLDQPATINGTANMVRQTLTPTSNRTVTGVGVRVVRSSGSGALSLRLETSGGTNIETVTIPAAEIDLGVVLAGERSGNWAYEAFTTPRLLSSGSTYHLRLSTDGSTTYYAVPNREGYDSGDTGGNGNPTGMRSFQFREGQGEETTNSGADWDMIYLFSPVDLQFYFTTTAALGGGATFTANAVLAAEEGPAGAAPAFDAAVESIRTDTSDPYTWVHTPVGTPKGVIVGVVHGGVVSTDYVVGITYGGQALERVETAVDTGGEPGRADLWFLGTGIPTGAQTVSADLTTGTTDDIMFVSVTLTGDGDTEIIMSDVFSTGSNMQSPQGTLLYGGREGLAFCALYTGEDAPTDVSLLSGMTSVAAHDFGAVMGLVDRQTTGGASDFTIGYTTVSSDDTALVALAVGVISSLGGESTFTANAVLKVAISGSLTSNSVLKKTTAGSWTGSAVIKKGLSGSLSANSVLKNTVGNTFSANSITRRSVSATFTADSVLEDVPAPPVSLWTVPDNGVPIALTETFAFLSPVSASDQHFQMEFDKANDFSTGFYALSDSSLDDTDWEYYDGDSWEPLPSTGLPAAASGNEVRFTKTFPTGGNWYRRVRGSA